MILLFELYCSRSNFNCFMMAFAVALALLFHVASLEMALEQKKHS